MDMSKGGGEEQI